MNYGKPNAHNRALNKPKSANGSFSGKKVRIFNSFKEQEDEMIEYWASITPFQRLGHLYEMVKISFKITEEDARHTHFSKKITIINNGS